MVVDIRIKIFFEMKFWGCVFIEIDELNWIVLNWVYLYICLKIVSRKEWFGILNNSGERLWKGWLNKSFSGMWFDM